MPFVIWVSGLPGSGKSTITKELIKLLKDDNISSELLRLDEIRKIYAPDPKYTEEERELVYKKLIEDAANIIEKGNNIIIDATAHRKKWREKAREIFKNYIEIYIKCSIETCIKREEERKEGLVMAELYKKALERKKGLKDHEGLGEVIGVDVPYEENKEAEIIIDSEKLKIEESAELILEELKRRKLINNE